MMKRILCLLLLLVSFSAWSFAPRVYLLTSFATPKIWFHKKEWRAHQPLEKIFKESFKNSGYEQIIIHEADQLELWNALHDPMAVAVFYVAHAGIEQQVGNGDVLKIDSIIADINIGDVKDVFKNIHPNIKFVSIVGCRAKSIVDKFTKEGYFDQYDDLTIHSFDKKISTKKGLKAAILESAKVISQNQKKKLFTPFKIEGTDELLNLENHKYVSSNTGYPISIERVIPIDADPSNIPSIRVTLREKINLGIFKRGIPGGVQKLTVYIPEMEFKNLSDLKIIMDSSTNPFSEPKPILGIISINPSWDNGAYEVFANKKTGIPYGVDKRIFRYTGSLKFNTQPKRYSLYSIFI